ncbi:MAG: ATP12 family chaperone protein [Alkalilacustris sp.]
MSGASQPWAPRRFWTDVAVAEVPGGWAVRLDARPLRTPGRAELVVPARGLAEAVAREWAAQDGVLRPETMPMTRAVNSAIDRVAPDPAPLVAEIAGYGASDLICHRAPEPEGLVRRQAEGWDPLLDWADRALGARLVPVVGVMPARQPADSLAALHAAVGRFDAFGLTALGEAVALSGSVVIGLALASGARDAADLWARAQIDEAWQAEQWGQDDEAAAATALRAEAFVRAADILGLLRAGAPAG